MESAEMIGHVAVYVSLFPTAYDLLQFVVALGKKVSKVKCATSGRRICSILCREALSGL